MRGARSRRGKSNTTKNARTVVWAIGRRRSLLQRGGRLRPATLYWLRRPQPQTRMQKVSYDAVREEWGQVKCNCSHAVFQNAWHSEFLLKHVLQGHIFPLRHLSRPGKNSTTPVAGSIIPECPIPIPRIVFRESSLSECRTRL